MDYDALRKEIENAEYITIFRHTNPDCDATGSQFALQNWIKDNWNTKHVYALGKENNTQGVWPKNDVVSDAIIQKSLAIVCDTANTARIDDTRYAQASRILKVDHHPNREPFGDVMFVNDHAAAVCEILTEFFASQSDLIFSKKTAEFLYKGLLTDTLNYTTNNTTPNTLECGAILASKGLDLSSISHEVFDHSIQGFRFTGYVISHTKMIGEHMAYVLIPTQDHEAYGLDAGQARSYVGKLGNVRDFHVWAVFNQRTNENGTIVYDGSLRSKKTPINDIAEKFGGGGHPCAAGVKNLSEEEFQEILRLLVARI